MKYSIKQLSKRQKIIYGGALVVLLIFGYRLIKAQQRPNVETASQAVAVKVVSVADSRQASRSLNYPAIVVAEQEAKIYARSSGSLRGSFKVGDKVRLGQELSKIEEIGSAVTSTGLNATQIKQATITVNQAKTAYDLARRNYDNNLNSVARDLEQAKISRDQAATGKTNLNISTQEAYKGAKLAYDAAKIALDNAKKKSTQTSSDTRENADIAADSAVNSSGSALTSINNMAGFDESGSVYIAYQSNLSAADSQQYNKARSAYQATRDAYKKFQSQSFSDQVIKLNEAIKVAESAKAMVTDTRLMMDKAVSSPSLPSATLSGFQASLSAMEGQISAALAQAKGARQALNNLTLNNDSMIESLSKSFELAAQNLASLQAGNVSQIDQATYNASAANNQFENIRIKLDSQLAAARAQMESANFQYQNASVALQSLYDSHQVIAPIDGVVTQKLVADGETVGPGQLIAVVSQTDKLIVRFYIEEEILPYFKPGLAVKIKDSNNQEVTAVVSAVSPQADPITKRFQVDLKPQTELKLTSGSVVDVNVDLIEAAGAKDSIIIPLALINVGQNEASIMIVEADRAKKQVVKIVKVIGEYAELTTDLPNDAKIIIEGAKQVQDGTLISY